MDTPTLCGVKITTRKGMAMLPTNRPPTHPGEMLLEEFLNAYDPPVTQTDAARRLGWTRVRLNQLILGHRGVTAENAIALATLTGTSPEFWMNLQAQYDLWHAQRARAPRVTPLARRGAPTRTREHAAAR